MYQIRPTLRWRCGCGFTSNSLLHWMLWRLRCDKCSASFCWPLALGACLAYFSLTGLVLHQWQLHFSRIFLYGVPVLLFQWLLQLVLVGTLSKYCCRTTCYTTTPTTLASFRSWDKAWWCTRYAQILLGCFHQFGSIDASLAGAGLCVSTDGSAFECCTSDVVSTSINFTGAVLMSQSQSCWLPADQNTIHQVCAGTSLKLCQQNPAELTQ